MRHFATASILAMATDSTYGANWRLQRPQPAHEAHHLIEAVDQAVIPELQQKEVMPAAEKESFI